MESVGFQQIAVKFGGYEAEELFEHMLYAQTGKGAHRGGRNGLVMCTDVAQGMVPCIGARG